MKKVILFRKALTREGGAERLLLEVAKNLEKMGIQVQVVVAKGHDMDKLFNGEYAKVPVYRFWSGDYPENMLAKILISIGTIFKLRKVIGEFHPDAITASNQADAEAMFLATLGTGFKYHVFIPGSLFCFPEESLKYVGPFKKSFREIRDSLPGHMEFVPSTIPDKRWWARPLLASRAWFQYWSVRKALSVFCHSERMGWELNKLYGSSTTALKCGVNLALLDYPENPDIKIKYGVPEGGKMLFDASRLVVGKREALSIKTVKAIRETKEDVYAVIGGKGPEKGNLEKLCNELEVSDRVNLAGYLPEKDLMDLYSSADIILHPAWIDFDITVMEGLSFGRKVICSSEYDISGPLDRLKDRQIFQSEPTPEAMKEAVLRALSSENTPKQEIREILTSYTWEAYSKNLWEKIKT
jgi:glycosyltransferase involved in cell wall biosynthesis